MMASDNVPVRSPEETIRAEEARVRDAMAANSLRAELSGLVSAAQNRERARDNLMVLLAEAMAVLLGDSDRPALARELNAAAQSLRLSARDAGPSPVAETRRVVGGEDHGVSRYLAESLQTKR